jgi:hypothetical protein
MSKSVRNSHPQCENPKAPRFRCLDSAHISAIESLYKQYPFLSNRVEIHLPFQRAKQAFSTDTIWIWAKFDKRPVGYLLFIEGFAPCIWYPDRQEGMTFRWLLPPTFYQFGPTVCLANILTSESLLQIEDILIYEGCDLWSTSVYSERWNRLEEFWNSLPEEQPLLAFKPQLIQPMTLLEWSQLHSTAIQSKWWIMQPDYSKSPRWYWRDITDNQPQHTIESIKRTEKESSFYLKDTSTETPVVAYNTEYKYKFVPPMLKRSNEMMIVLYAFCTPYRNSSTILPDTYYLLSQSQELIGVASITSLDVSRQLYNTFKNTDSKGIPVEVKWNATFSKYQVVKIMPDTTLITTHSFFNHNK